MSIGNSSETFAGNRVEHRAGKKGEANGYEQCVEHERALWFSAYMAATPI